jgi:addiction module HigA family antidote
MASKGKLPPIHPGEILKEDFLKPLALSMNKLAAELHVPTNRISAIVEGTRGISGDTALRLGRYFEMSPEFWINLQARYELEKARDEAGAAIEAEVHPRSHKSALKQAS